MQNAPLYFARFVVGVIALTVAVFAMCSIIVYRVSVMPQLDRLASAERQYTDILKRTSQTEFTLNGIEYVLDYKEVGDLYSYSKRLDRIDPEGSIMGIRSSQERFRGDIHDTDRVIEYLKTYPIQGDCALTQAGETCIDGDNSVILPVGDRR